MFAQGRALTQGDTVYIIEDVLDHTGTVLSPGTTGRGTIVGFVGAVTAVVQWGSFGDYQHADVPFEKLRVYDRRRR